MDRPYGPLLNLLHHGIGSTHVCHHINPRIPHYNAWRASALLKQRLGVEVLVELVAVRALSELTGVETRQKPIRLIVKT